MIEIAKTLNSAEFTPAGWQVRHLSAAKHTGSGLFEHLRFKLRSGALARLIVRFRGFSLWFSLPLSIWLTTGWVGLIFHWQAISKMACQMDDVTLKRNPAFARLSAVELVQHAHQKPGRMRVGSCLFGEPTSRGRQY
jgi:hypothetical protein